MGRATWPKIRWKDNCRKSGLEARSLTALRAQEDALSAGHWPTTFSGGEGLGLFFIASTSSHGTATRHSSFKLNAISMSGRCAEN